MYFILYYYLFLCIYTIVKLQNNKTKIETYFKTQIIDKII